MKIKKLSVYFLSALMVLMLLTPLLANGQQEVARINDWRELESYLLDNPDALLIDVRTQSEYDSGHIPGAILIPHTEILAAPLDISTDTPIVVYCRSGNRSGQVFRELTARGYTNLIDFGGINRWGGDLSYGDS